MRKRRLRVIGIGLLFLLLATGCSAPKEIPATTETGESTFSASETGTDESATAESGAGEVTEENSAIALTKMALAETDWISIQMEEERIDMPANEAFLAALAFDTWESVEEEIESEEIMRFAVGNGEIVIFERAAYLLTDHGMDWYRTPEDVLSSVMDYFEKNFTMSARSMLFNDEYMFANYYHDTIPTLGNLETFDGRGPLVWEMVRYAWDRFTYENAEETIRALYDEDMDGYLVSREMAIQECKKYFDFDEAATEFSSVNFYLPEVDGFKLWYAGPDQSDRSNFQNGWGYAFGGIKEIGKEQYEIRLVDYVDSSQTRINKTNVMEISFDGEGNIRFDRGYEDVPSYNLADTAPDLEAIEIVREYEYMNGVFLGETENAYFYIGDDGEWVSYLKLDKASMEMTTIYAPDMADEEFSYRVEQHGEEFYFYTNKNVRITDADWKLIETVAYPKAIVEGLESYWEQYGDPIYFGEALSDDRSMFAYVDQDGLKLVENDSNETTLVVPREGDGGVTEAIWCLNPRFADHDTKIVTSRTRDWDSGFTVYDIKAKTSKTESGYVMPSEWLLAGDRGFFMSDKSYLYFYDFQLDQVKEVPFEGYCSEVSDISYLLANESYATYFDTKDDVKTLVLLDLASWSIIQKASIENMDVGFNFLDRNGDVGVSYSFSWTDHGNAIMRNE